MTTTDTFTKTGQNTPDNADALGVMVVPAAEALTRTGLALTVDGLLERLDREIPTARANELSEHLDLTVLTGERAPLALSAGVIVARGS
jgi:hypothetical protein